MEKRKSIYKYLPLIFSILLVIGIFIGSRINAPFLKQQKFFTPKTSQFNKLSDVISYIQQQYVDTVDQKHMVDISIENMLASLDPHSSYISADQLQTANEPLEGNFGGIGIEFHIQQDTIMVVNVIDGGPSQAAGLKAGDRIFEIEGENVGGTGITNEDVMDKLRGKSGTIVNVKVKRRNTKNIVDVPLTRGQIPIKSVEAAFMLDENTGYIKITRFAAKTYDEYLDAFRNLRIKGMQDMILDLRDNPGGYLDAATNLADEFLGSNKIIVYTKGKARPKTVYKASAEGTFETGRLIVLIDEGSASASEILAGALQDWDRATIIGRRSFGKGLVQEQTVFPDGSAIRLTISRYYTPVGRCIQKPYDGDIEKYNREVYKRYQNGELQDGERMPLNDSLVFITSSGKKVFGGGGITPDIFVPIDTSYNTNYLRRLYRNRTINQVAFDFVDRNRKRLKEFSDFSAFNSAFKVSESDLTKILALAEKQGIQHSADEYARSKDHIAMQLKALIARQI
ncbi:MAG: S41 family peptidase, partial [Bacteroidia bacterium]|nr:S41 family peptidase [Bacteroidia bacterium]